MTRPIFPRSQTDSTWGLACFFTVLIATGMLFDIEYLPDFPLDRVVLDATAYSAIQLFIASAVALVYGRFGTYWKTVFVLTYLFIFF